MLRQLSKGLASGSRAIYRQAARMHWSYGRHHLGLRPEGRVTETACEVSKQEQRK
jgi:hypothetical protein